MSEFAFLGDTQFRHPEPGTPDALARYFEAVYLRDSPAGPHDELWFHTRGCRTWLRVTRDTLTREILSVQFARGELRTAGNGSSTLPADRESS